MAVSVSRMDLEDLIGPEATALLLAKFGGLSLYIPRRPGAGKAIEAVVGAVAFEVLQGEFGKLNVNLPGKAKAPSLKERIIPLIEAGLSLNEIAQQLGCTWRHVAYVKQDMGLSKPSPRRKKRQQPRTGARHEA